MNARAQGIGIDFQTRGKVLNGASGGKNVNSVRVEFLLSIRLAPMCKLFINAVMLRRNTLPT